VTSMASLGSEANLQETVLLVESGRDHSWASGAPAQGHRRTNSEDEGEPTRRRRRRARDTEHPPR